MIKNLLKQFFVYIGGSVGQAALNFVLLPLLLHFFEPAEYGVISLLLVGNTLLLVLANAGVVSALHRLYFETKIEERKKLVGTTWLWHFLSATPLTIMIFFNSSSISRVLFHAESFSYPIKLFSVFFFLFLLRNIPFEIFRLEKKSGLYVGFSLLGLIADLTLKFYFIAFLKRGIGGYFESSIISTGAFLCFMLPFIWKYVNFSLNIGSLRQILRLGFPFIFSSISIWTLGLADRFILNIFAGTAAVGIYSLGYNFANLFNVFLFSPSAVLWSPFFFSYAVERSEKDTKKLLGRSLTYFFIPGCFLYLAISLGSGDVLKIFTLLFSAKENYLGAAKIVPLLALGSFLYLLARPAGSALLLAKKPEFIAIAGGIAAVVNVGLNFLLIPKLGIYGAALTTIIAYALFLWLVYQWAQRILSVNYDFRELSKGFLFLAISLIIPWQIRIAQPVISLFVRVTVSIVIFAFLVWFSSEILKPSERYRLLSYAKKVRRRFVARLPHRS